MFFKYPALLISLCFIFSPFTAAATDSDDTALAFTLEPIVVTATRRAQTADDTLASVTVLTREAIQRSQATDLRELLTGIVGMDFSNNGGRGKNTGVFLRGTSSGHVLVLVDGAKIGSATLGSAAFEHLPLAHIERIEIVRGPRSSLYGSEAVGGVIQIFTHKSEPGFSGQQQFGAGRYGTTAAALSVNTGTEDTRLHVRVSHDETRGFNARPGNDPDADGYINTSVSASLDHTISRALRLQTTLLRTEAHNEYDGWSASSEYHNNNVQQAASATLHYTPQHNWELILSVDQGRDESDEYADDARTDRFDTTRNRISLQTNVSLRNALQITFGIDRQTDKVTSTTAYSETSRGNTGVFWQQQWSGDQADVLLAIRNDRNDAFGNKASGNLAWGYTFSRALRVTAAIGTAYKTPTFNDLYFPGSGNSALSPETATSTEIGVSGKPAWGHWQLNIYRTKIKDLINWACATHCDDSDPFNDRWRPFNLNQALIRGIEAQLGTEIQAWQIALSLSLLDPEDTNSHNKLQKRAMRSARLDLDRAFGKLGFGTTLIAQGHRYPDTANSSKLAGYRLLNLRGHYRFGSDWTLRATVDNLFRKKYTLTEGYNTAGREFFLSIAHRF